MPRKPKHIYPLEQQLEIGRLCELGKSLRGKALCLKFDICHQTLINFAKTYRKLQTASHATTSEPSVEN